MCWNQMMQISRYRGEVRISLFLHPHTGCCPLIGREWSHDLDAGLWLVIIPPSSAPRIARGEKWRERVIAYDHTELWLVSLSHTELWLVIAYDHYLSPHLSQMQRELRGPRHHRSWTENHAADSNDCMIIIILMAVWIKISCLSKELLLCQLTLDTLSAVNHFLVVNLAGSRWI